MAIKLLSLYLLAVAGLGIVRAAPLILDQRQDNPNGTLTQGPSNQFGPVFNVTDFPINLTSVAFKRAAPLVLDQRQDNPNNTVSQGPQQPSCATSANNPNGTLGQQPNSATSANDPNGTQGQQSSCTTSANNPSGSLGQQPVPTNAAKRAAPLILDRRQENPSGIPVQQPSNVASPIINNATSTGVPSNNINATSTGAPNNNPTITSGPVN